MAEWGDVEQATASQLISTSKHHKPQSGGLLCRGPRTGNRHILQPEVITQEENSAFSSVCTGFLGERDISKSGTPNYLTEGVQVEISS